RPGVRVLPGWALSELLQALAQAPHSELARHLHARREVGAAVRRRLHVDALQRRDLLERAQLLRALAQGRRSARPKRPFAGANREGVLGGLQQGLERAVAA